MFFWNSLVLSMQMLADVGNLLSGSSSFSKTSLNVRKFTVHILLKPGLENFEHYFTSMWDESRWAGHGGDIWQNVVHWRREWQTPSVFLPSEPLNSMKRQNDRILKGELPRSVGTWVWVNSRNWWWTGRPGVLQFMGSQRVWHDWATELNWRGFLSGSDGKESTCNVGDLGSIPGEGNGNPI